MVKTIFWDFDGVIMNSMPIRNKGFELVLKDYPSTEVAQLMTYHLSNGGLSRYVKFRYFFEKIRREINVTEDKILRYASMFSKVMLKELKNPDLLIDDSLAFIKSNYGRYDMHIVSGSDQTELRQICSSIGIDQYFSTINGSPASKTEILKELLNRFEYQTQNCVLVGDSINDLSAAKSFGIHFIGYNNPALLSLSDSYLESFREF